MSEQTFPQTFVKGSETKTVRNAREAVAAKFAGFKAAAAVIAETKPDYETLQALAKDAGIPANKRRDQIVEGLQAAETESAKAGHREPEQSAGEGEAQPHTLNETPAPAKPTSLDEAPHPATPATLVQEPKAPKPTAPTKAERPSKA